MQRHSPNRLDLAGNSRAPHRLSLYLSAAFVGLALSWLPGVARADELNWETDVTYSVEVEQGVLHVESKLILTNQKPNTQSGNTITQSFFKGIGIYIPELVTNVSITTDGKDLDYSFEVIEDEKFDAFKLASIEFASNIFFTRTRSRFLVSSSEHHDPRRVRPCRRGSS